MIKRSLVYGVWTGFFVCVIACLSVSLPSVCLSLGLFVCLSVCLSFSSLSISLSFSLYFFLSVCLSACKFVCLSVFLYMSVWLFIYLSAYLFVWLLSVYLFVFLSVCLCLSLCLSISVLSVDRSVFLSVCLCTFIFVCMYVFLSVWLSLCFCFVFYSLRPCVCQPVHLTACLSAALLLNHTHFHTINVFFRCSYQHNSTCPYSCFKHNYNCITRTNDTNVSNEKNKQVDNGITDPVFKQFCFFTFPFRSFITTYSYKGHCNCDHDCSLSGLYYYYRLHFTAVNVVNKIFLSSLWLSS